MAPLPIEVDLQGDVNVTHVAGTAQTARDIGASVLLSTGTGTGQLDFTSGVVKANATQWLGGTIPAVNVTGVPLVDNKYLLGTVYPTPTVAGVPNVNTKTINDVATTSVTAVNANLGTTQPVNFHGTGATAYVKSDILEVLDTAASPSAVDANVTQIGGSTQSATDLKDFADTGYDPATHKVAGVVLVDLATQATTVVSLTNAPTVGDFTATMKASIGTAVAASPVASVTAAVTLTSGERNSIATALLDLANGVESNITLRQAVRAMAAVLAGARTDSGTNAEAFAAIGTPGTPRVASNVDTAGDGTPTLTL